MKRILLFISAGLILLASCSPAKYSYHFDKVKHGGQVTKAGTAASDPLNVLPETLVASVTTSSYEVLPAETETLPTVTASRSKGQSLKEVKQQLRAAVKELKTTKSTLKQKDPTTEQGAKKKMGRKEGLAIAGFVLSLVGFFTPLGLAIVCLVLGLIFSALGLKSERRGLAIAGLVISIIGLAILLIAGSLIASA